MSVFFYLTISVLEKLDALFTPTLTDLLLINLISEKLLVEQLVFSSNFYSLLLAKLI